MKKISFIGILFYAGMAFAENPFEVHFDSTVPFMEDNDTVVFDGMRVEGAGLSAANDALRLKFNFDYDTLNFTLDRNDINIYSNIGIFNEEHMTKNVAVPQPTYVVNGTTYNFDQTYSFVSTTNEPFIADLNLQTGHVVSWVMSNQSSSYSYEMTGDNINIQFNGLAFQGIISGAQRILTDGTYRIKFIPTNASTLTFNLKLFNANHKLLSELVDNDIIFVSFENSVRDYAKYEITLGAGDTLTVSQPSSADIRLKLVDELGRAVLRVSGLALIYSAEQQGKYYLFIDNQNGHGGSYFGNISITPGSLPLSKKQKNHIRYDKASIARP